jgi:hypothetical protein
MTFSLGITLVVFFGISSYLMVDFGTRLRKITGKKRYTWIPVGWLLISVIVMTVTRIITEAVLNSHLHP